MTAVLIICIFSCISMIALVLFKPKLNIKGISISTYWIVIMLGACVLLIFKFISLDDVFQGLTADTAINPLKILVLFLSMTILSIFLDEMGFFNYLANLVLKKSGSGQFKLFTAFYLTISVLTVFTSNDIIILTFTPFICYFTKNAKINPIPYLVSEFVAANTCSMLLIIGNPTNIYIATASGINFVEYFKVMSLPTVFAIIVAYFVMLLLFYKQIKLPLSPEINEVTINNKPLLIIGLVFLSVSTVLLAVSSYINIEMWFIAFCSAIGLIATVLLYSLIKRKKLNQLRHTLRRVPWELIPFVISMFILVLSLEKYEVTNKIAQLLAAGNVIINYGTASVLFANLINNIPMSVLFSSVLQNLSPQLIIQGIYSVIIGSNIGAFLTPIGALAGIMWLQILKTHNVDFNFAKFLKYGILIAVPTLAAALLGLMIII